MEIPSVADMSSKESGSEARGIAHAKTLRRILDILARHHEDADLDMVRDAFRLATHVHALQERKADHQPYIVHPLAVALACAEQRMDDVSVASAILHDCIEDVDETFDLRPAILREALGDLLAGIFEDLLAAGPGEGISRAKPDKDKVKDLLTAVVALRFGPEVVGIIEGLTKLRTEDVSLDRDAKTATLVKLVKTTAADDIRAIVIKIYDRCDNIRTIDVFSEDKRRRIATETMQFYVPIATRLGFFHEAREMEDHVMRVLQPEVHEIIRDWLETNDKRIRWRVEREVREITDELAEMGVSCRSSLYPKGIFSIFQGLPAKEHLRRRIGEGVNFNLCLVVDSEDACFRTLHLVHQHFTHLPARVRDFINNPKVNGYQSLHTICTGHKLPKIQVLVRTEAMDLDNHIGVISQLHAGKLEETGWLRDIVESFQTLGGADLLKFTSRVAYAEIDVFTPLGDARKLPEGATALDFAYEIHTEVGDHARVALVDGRVRPLGTVLQSGQRVEIVTSGDVQPSYQSFGQVITPKATVAIRKALQQIEKDAAEQEVERFLRFCRRKLQVNLDPAGPEFLQFLENLGLVSAEALGHEIHAGRTDYDHLIPALVEVLPSTDFDGLLEVLDEQGVLAESTVTSEGDDEDTLRSMIHEAISEHVHKDEPPEEPIEIVGVRHKLPLRLAGCCRPKYGDEIIAYTSRGRGASIHKRSCGAVQRMVEQGSARVADARWARPPQLQLVRYDITGHDRQGLFLSVSSKLAEMGIDAQAIKLTAGADALARGYARLELDDLSDREDIARKLRVIPGITSVSIREGHSKDGDRRIPQDDD